MSVITIDLTSALIGLILPPLIVFLCGVALICAKRLSTYHVGSYVKDTVRSNNKLIEENRQLRKELGYEDFKELKR